MHCRPANANGSLGKSSDSNPAELESLDEETKAETDRDSAGGRTDANIAGLVGDYPGWVDGRGLPARATSTRNDGLPDVLGEIEALCLGKTPTTANTIELKQRLVTLIHEIDAMDEEQKLALAAWFREQENPAVKYHVMVVFR